MVAQWRTWSSKLTISIKTVHFLLTAIILLVTAGSLFRLYQVSLAQLHAPHDIFFETHNLATIKSIESGDSIYSPRYYNNLPFIITIYNPLFHYLTALLPQSTVNPFFTGRMVSLGATLLVALLLFMPGNVKRYPMVPLLAIAYFFLIREPVKGAAYLRSDTLALLLAALAVVNAEKKCGNKWHVAFAATLCLLAFSAKQSFLAATGTCFIFFLLRDRKNGIRFGFVSFVLFTAFFLFAQLRWGTGYWFSAYTSMLSNEITLQMLVILWSRMLGQPLFVLLVLSTIVTVSYALRKARSAALVKSPYALYLMTTFVVLMMTISKKGADTNYFLEFILACLLWHVLFVREWCPGVDKRFASVLAVGVVFVCAALEVTKTSCQLYSYTDPEMTAVVESLYELAREEIEQLQPPDDRFLNLNSSTATYSLQSRAYVSDTFNYWLLWNEGLLDIGPLLQAIQNKYFSVVMLYNPENPIGVITPLKHTIPDAPARRVLEALKRNYHFAKKGVFIYFVPGKDRFADRV